MKTSKFLLIFLVSLALFQSIKAQNRQSIIYDAIAIQNSLRGLNKILIPTEGSSFNKIDPQTGETITGAIDLSEEDKDTVKCKANILAILRRNAGLPASANEKDIQAFYKGNPFLKDILSQPIKTLDKFVSLPGYQSGTEVGGALRDIGNNMANAFAQIIIEHATKELAIGVFDRLQKIINRYPEFNILFPKTLKVLKNISPYDYDKFLSSLKNNIEEDLTQFPVKVPELYELPKYQLLNKKFPELTLIFSASRIVSELDLKKNTAFVIANIDTSKFLNEKNNYASFIKLSSITAGSLQKRSLKDDEESYISYFRLSDFKQIHRGDETYKKALLNTYLGLLYEQTKNISFYKAGEEFKFTKQLEKIAENDQLLDNLMAGTSKIQDISDKLKEIKEFDINRSEASGKIFYSTQRIECYNKIAISTTELIAPFLTGSRDKNVIELERIMKYWPSFSTAGINMYKNFKIKEYESGLQNFSEILFSLEQYLKERESDKQKSAALSQEMADALDIQITAIKSKQQALTASLKEINNGIPIEDPSKIDMLAEQQELQKKLTAENEKLVNIEWQKTNKEKVLFSLAKILETYNLLAAMSKTEDSKQLEQVLEKYALPAGSSRIKKDTEFNIAVNAYVGGFFGRTKSSGTGFTNEYGLTAPVGFTFSHGFGQVGSISAFAGVFDLGSVVRYKLDNDGKYQQDVNLAGLISPSVHLIYGLPWYIPVSFGAGYQWTTPSTEATNHIKLRPHFNLFLSVDVPLFNLAVSKKRR